MRKIKFIYLCLCILLIINFIDFILLDNKIIIGMFSYFKIDNPDIFGNAFDILWVAMLPILYSGPHIKKYLASLPVYLVLGVYVYINSPQLSTGYSFGFGDTLALLTVLYFAVITFFIFIIHLLSLYKIGYKKYSLCFTSRLNFNTVIVWMSFVISCYLLFTTEGHFCSDIACDWFYGAKMFFVVSSLTALSFLPFYNKRKL